MRLADFAASLQSKLEPLQQAHGWFSKVSHKTDIMDVVTFWFATTQRDKWPNQILQNSDYVIVKVSTKGAKREDEGSGLYQLTSLARHNLPQLTAKTGSLEQLEAYLMKYLAKVASLSDGTAPKRMRLDDFLVSFKSKLDAIAPPGWTYEVTRETAGKGLMDSVDLRFAATPKEKWPHNIWHNAPVMLVSVDERFKQKEIGVGPYQCRTDHISDLPKLLGKSGTLEQIEAHLIGYFKKLASSQPAVTTESLVESLLASN